jgi:hypothetical protein
MFRTVTDDRSSSESVRKIQNQWIITPLASIAPGQPLGILHETSDVS